MSACCLRIGKNPNFARLVEEAISMLKKINSNVMVQTIDPNKLTCRSAISICLKRTVYHFGHKLFYYSIENTFFYHHLPFTNQRYSSYIRHPREERQNNGNNIEGRVAKLYRVSYPRGSMERGTILIRCGNKFAPFLSSGNV